jgi:hypothetical protein
VAHRRRVPGDCLAPVRAAASGARLAGFLVIYLALEVTALAGALAVWARCGRAWRRDAIRYQDLNFRLIEGLPARLCRAARWLFGLRVEARAGQQERQEARAGALPGPVIVLGRHAGARPDQSTKLRDSGDLALGRPCGPSGRGTV